MNGYFQSIVKTAIKNNPITWQIYKNKFNSNSVHCGLTKKDTQLCIEGFPRSSNTFSYYLLYVTNPNIEYAHHTHCIQNIKYALKRGIPCVIILRNPLDAITSVCMKKKNFFKVDYKKALIHALRENILFNEFAYKNLDKIELIRFETVINTPDVFIKKVDEVFGDALLENNELSFDQIVDNAKELIKNSPMELKKGDLAKALPSDKKASNNQMMKNEIKNMYVEYWGSANSIYNKIINYKKVLKERIYEKQNVVRLNNSNI